MQTRRTNDARSFVSVLQGEAWNTWDLRSTLLKDSTRALSRVTWEASAPHALDAEIGGAAPSG